ncbi:MAG TPA: threonine/serine dehydratase [Gemmatimonadales bacterium]|nr:threonine/serine dehydratase [Gemmatimonadales bacterium]
MELAISRAEIEKTYPVIAPRIRRTPVVSVSAAELGLADFPLTLKLELLQRAGSFKIRGAFTNLLLRKVPKAGVVAASGGNHGVAVAFAAQNVGVPARIYIPRVASPAKVERIRSSGAELCITGDRYADALAASEVWAAESGALPVHAFDQRETLLGQGTVGLELSAQAPDLDTLLVPVGGGGIIGGIAAWYQGGIRLIGVEPVDAPTLTAALEAGRPVDAPTGGIAADSLAPKRVGELTFPLAQRYVDRVVLVTDDDIRRAQSVLWSGLRIVAEPGGAATVAALLAGAYRPKAGEKVGVLLSGGNTTGVSFEGRMSPAGASPPEMQPAAT